MRSGFLVLLLFVCHAWVRNTEVEATQWYNITEEESMEIEKQLKLLNKPAIKSIHSEYGDVYDCVDFYKQPGFDHPLLKDYKFDYKIVSPKSMNGQVLAEKRKPSNFRLIGGGCPLGTVPIKRITKEDLIRERYLSTIRPLAENDTSEAHYAVIRTKPTGKRYNGAGGKVTIHNPQCTHTQYSAARVKIQNGPDSIEAGWRVDPALYGDTKTRLYVRFDAGQVHCLNTRCPGFIVVNTDMPLGIPFSYVSIPGEHTYYDHFFLNRDLINGNWWFQFGDDYTQVGFWPARIFTGLSDWATSAEWGGEVFSPSGTIKPPMGAGENILKDTEVDAYIYECVLLDGNITLNADDVDTFADSKTYQVADGGTSRIFRHLVMYGVLLVTKIWSNFYRKNMGEF